MGGVVQLVPETTQIKLVKVHKKLVRSNGPGLLKTKECKIISPELLKANDTMD